VKKKRRRSEREGEREGDRREKGRRRPRNLNDEGDESSDSRDKKSDENDSSPRNDHLIGNDLRRRWRERWSIGDYGTTARRNLKGVKKRGRGRRRMGGKGAGGEEKLAAK